nr:PAS domain S-box protein [Ramlibacter aurantiacus]
MQEAVVVLDATGALCMVNRAASRVLSRDPDQLMGRHLRELVSEDPERVQAFLARCARTRSASPESLRFIVPGQDPVTLRCEGSLMSPRSEAGPALVLLRLRPREVKYDQFLLLKQRIDQLSHEISRRRAAEVSLMETKEWYRVTLESIGDAVIVTDPQGRVTFLNAVAEELTGWTRADAGGRHLDEVFVIVNDETREPVESPVTKVLRMGGIVGLANHTLLLRKDGHELPIDDSGAPLRAADGQLLGVVLVFRDLTERYRLERELSIKARDLADADRRKDEFLSMLAHELRNPLAPLRSGVRLLSIRHGDLPDIARLAGIMGRQVNHMVRLVDDLLDVARLTRGSLNLQKQPTRLSDVVERAAEMVRATMDERGIHFQFALPPTEAVVDADAHRLVQVLGNLLANAAKFTPPGGQVDVGAYATRDEVVVSVIDTGMGIEPELLPHIFELFKQGDASLGRSHGGLGIGLSVARTIVHMHGGTIDASSRGPGQGSEFVVRLPLLGEAGLSNPA